MISMMMMAFCNVADQQKTKDFFTSHDNRQELLRSQHPTYHYPRANLGPGCGDCGDNHGNNVSHITYSFLAAVLSTWLIKQANIPSNIQTSSVQEFAGQSFKKVKKFMYSKLPSQQNYF